MTVFGLGVLIDTGIFCQVFGKRISWFVVEVFISFLVVCSLVHIALEFVVVGGGAVNIVGLALATLFNIS